MEQRLQLSAAVNVTNYRYGNLTSGVNSLETQLTPTNVKTGTFGKLFTTPLDGQVYAEPLTETAVTIDAGVNTTAGAAGVHDVVFVATENDSLYAINADAGGGQILWKRSFLNTANTGGNINNTLGATSIAVVTNADVSSADIMPSYGITSTPVIDSSTGTLYVVTLTKEVVGGATYFVQRLHAINISDGTDVVAPYLIGETTNLNKNTTNIYAYGTGDGSVTDPYNGTGKKVVQFDALTDFNRVALSLVNNTIYIGWASHGDNGPYHGWVVTWNVANLKTSGFQLSGVLCTSPNDGEAGVWQSGGAIAFEPDDSAFYFMTGNGTGGAPTLNSSGFPTDANYNEAVVKAELDPTTSPTNQGPNGWGIKVVDYFIPYNVAAMDAADSDFGSGGPLLLPASAGIAGHANLLIAGGKDGRVYVLDRGNLGHYHSTGDPGALNSVLNSSGQLTPPNAIAGTLSTPTYFNGHLYLISGYTGNAKAFSISSTGQLVAASQTALSSLGYEPGGPVVSANGTSNGIVWMMDRNSNEIHAYNASTLSTELWNSNDASGDNLGAVVKFAEPTIANGEVYVGTTDALVVYGLTQSAAAAPRTPVLSATALSGSAINLTWTDPTVSPNQASVYLIDESSNGSPFTQAATAPAGAASIAIGGLQPLITYSFEIAGQNSFGTSPFSTPAVATTTNQAAAISFAGGFSGATSLTLNGEAKINSSDLELTDGGNNEASSAFYSTPVGITSFTSQFSFQLSAGTAIADGFTFTLQDVAPTALGPSGGGLGYGPATSGNVGGIADSAAIKFDLYNNEGEGVDSTGLFTGGAAPTGGANSINLSSTAINLHSGDLFQVNLAYGAATLTETIADQTTGKSVTETYAVNLAAVIGSNSAYAGFTAGTGGESAVQNILSWTYSPSAATSPNAPSGLGATPATATSVNLTWTSNAANQTGYHLDRAADPGFTQNLITETLPASPASFTDITTGLAPGNTYYYRLRAFNSAGDSGDSNVASVTIPLAPAKATNQSITNVTTNEIDITWQDNAGHTATGYNILRAVNLGSFTVVASLPPTSRTAPSEYSWADTTVTPGNYYEYHIEAVNTSGYNDFAGVNATTITLAPANVTATPASNGVNLAWGAVTGAASYNVYRGTSPGGESAAPIATGITGTTYSDTSATAGVTYYYEITAVNANAAYTPPLPSESAKSTEASTAPSAPAGPLTSSITIGAPKLGGSSSQSNGVYTITGAGSDIYNTSDQFQYVYAASNGNTTLTARVDSITDTYQWAKAGVMIRSSTAANAPFVDVVVTPVGYVSFQWRTSAGAAATSVILPAGTSKLPTFIRIVRTGNSFAGFYSSNGVNWIQVGSSVTLTAIPTVATAGLAVCSVNPSLACTAKFDDVTYATA